MRFKGLYCYFHFDMTERIKYSNKSDGKYENEKAIFQRRIFQRKRG